MKHSSLHATALAACALAGSATAQIGPAPTLSLSKALYEPGDALVLDLSGTPGDLAFLLVNSTAGNPFIPGLGTLGLALDAGLAILPAGALPQTGLVQLTCSIDCNSPLLEVPCLLQAVTIDPGQGAFRPPSNVEVLSFAGGDCGVCVDGAEADNFGQSTYDHALWLPGVAKDFVFVAGGDFFERADGTAIVTGEVASKAKPELRFEVDLLLTGRVSPGDVLYPPLNSPKLELDPLAYDSQGGPVNPAGWHYYSNTTGILTGRGDLEGGVIQVDRMGPAFQVGYGASGKNIQYGASGWLDIKVLSKPTTGKKLEPDSKGDFNFDIDRDCAACPDSAGNHALAIPQIGQDMVFVEGGQFVEHADGTATLRGVVADVQIPTRKWDIDVTLSVRVNPGSQTYPPATSPKLELPSGAYQQNGGSIDTDLWHYYLVTDGVMTGLGDNAGGLVKLTRMGPAFQVGFGASGKHTEYGGSGWLTVEVLAQPSAGPQYPQGKLTGDFNLDLDTDCPGGV
ncbi:hypothetical protein [Engelhardtia mirabilis]